MRLEDGLSEGTRIGAYLVHAVLGAGGCATVYLAEHADTGARVALKLLHRDFVVSPKMLARFTREVETIRRVAHPGVVRIDACGQLPDLRPYYVMELLHGVTLGAFVRQRGRLALDEALEILEPLCATLDAVHQAGVVHRDVSVSNVFLCEEAGRRALKIIDFGIAKLLSNEPSPDPLTTVGRRLGTPSAMAPEQILGLDVDARTDVYALGVLLYRMLTGTAPFRGERPADVESAHLHAPPPRPSQVAPTGLAVDAVVLRCLAKDREERYPGALAFLAELRRAVHETGRPGEVEPGGAGARAVAIHVAVSVAPETGAGVGDALLDGIGEMLDAAEEALAGAGYELVLQTGNALVGARLLPDDDREALRERRRAVRVTENLHDVLAAHPAADPRLSWLVCAHEDAAVSDERHVAGGPVLRLGAWVPHGVTGALVTRELLDRIGGAERVSPERHVRIRPGT